MLHLIRPSKERDHVECPDWLILNRIGNQGAMVGEILGEILTGNDLERIRKLQRMHLVCIVDMCSPETNYQFHPFCTLTDAGRCALDTVLRIAHERNAPLMHKVSIFSYTHTHMYIPSSFWETLYKHQNDLLIYY